MPITQLSVKVPNALSALRPIWQPSRSIFMTPVVGIRQLFDPKVQAARFRASAPAMTADSSLAGRAVSQRQPSSVQDARDPCLDLRFESPAVSISSAELRRAALHTVETGLSPYANIVDARFEPGVSKGEPETVANVRVPRSLPWKWIAAGAAALILLR